MLSKTDWPKSRSYRTGTDYEPIQFYVDGLCQSKRFDLLLGYFSSSAINVLSSGFAKFLYSGGSIRLVTNHILSKQDKEAIKKSGELCDKPNSLIDITDIKYLKQTLDEYGQHFFECLAWLIANKRIDLKIIKPNDGKGIAHYKSGAFFDGQNTAVFKASCNFTAYGLLENAEELECHLSWDVGSQNRIEDQTEYFENIFSGKATHVDYLNVDDIQEAIKNEFGDKTIDELLVQEKDLLEKRSKSFINPKLKRRFEAIQEEIEEIADQPRFPYPDGPRPYQIEAYNNWVTNNHKGIFAMATGTGKTITALNCLLEETLKNNGIYHALILVPTITLVEQWREEAKQFNFKEIIEVSSKTKWENKLATTVSMARKIPISFVVITTYASFVRERFFKEASKFPLDTIIIADEAHNIGALSVAKKIKEITFQKRIGLSATPKRIYDITGSEAMENFFNDSEPYTYTFSMERAIAEGILCKYYYHPHIVNLTVDEMDEYIRISKQLAKLFDPESGEFRSADIAERLLLKRKRIIHKASNKLAVVSAILEIRYREEKTLAYTFVYVPEGETEDVIELDDCDNVAESIKIINQYTRAIGKIDESVRVNQFTSGMKNRDEILEQFREGRIDVIASMKCLDEGVDIPRAEHAIFCSSTGNPRQFIQRRGRILRTHPDKNVAVIHDLVVVPDLNSNTSSDTYNLERNMVQKELERVMHFASLSMNPFETEEAFTEVCRHYNLNIYTIHQNLILT